MRDGGVDDRNLHQILLGILHALCDGGGNFVSLSKTITYNAVLVSDHYNCSEAEVTTTLRYLGNSLDGNQSVLELKVRSLYSFNICICHSLFF